MASYADYFAENRPQPKWFIGDRVFGKWNKIPFIGTVLNDNVVNEQDGPRVSIALDLPIQYQKKIYNIICVSQKDIKKCSNY